MRVNGVGAGPLFADDSAFSARLLRRVRGLVLEVGFFVILTPLLPVALAAAALVDLVRWVRHRKPWVGVRLVAMAWLTVLLGAMWVDGGLGRSDAHASHRDPAGAILMGWLLAPIVISLVALVFAFAARPRIRSDGRLVALSATIPLALYGVGVAVTLVLQAARCPG